MSLQETVLYRYLSLKKEKPTFKAISQETGIQMTRVFRLFNGHEMRVKELEVFEDLIVKEGQLDYQEWRAITNQAFETLSSTSLQELSKLMQRKIKTKNFIQEAPGPRDNKVSLLQLVS